MGRYFIACTLIILFTLCFNVQVRAEGILIDDFEAGLSPKWEQKSFKGKTLYKISQDEGKNCLKAISKASASALYYKINYDLKEYPILNWPWKIENIITKGNALKQEGKKYNVLVNAIAPIAATRMGEGTYPDELMPLLRPDLVASAVVFLASDQCDFTGHMIVAGGGRYARVQLVEGKGIWVDPRHDFTPEMFAERLDDVTNMEDARAFENFTEELTTILQHCSR